MKKTLITAVLALVSAGAFAQANVPSSEAQIKGAVLAAPSDKRAGATVFGYNAKGEFVQLRKGTNEMVCLADDPNQKGFSTACYHQDLEPFMARGRELRKAGKSNQEIFEMREQEAKSGKLAMPKQASTLFVYAAPEENYDSSTGEVKEGYLRYVVYIPYATAESTGLPLKPQAPAMPWIMHPGTHGAHIMINPPQQ
ncbi:hypothetical protein CLV24_13151 [Pontibacter ummariensis]|uniref:Uncharacterized protein n=1 Tax=Pontibacter ummariensis TaxID=1610492 RepID=A0A239KW50_9BACT|nr:hypothetical protein [Pontibacter ummariensis]PRY05034.1 hypothetical protein CLV24_13151 [Pontibacter ummariensis]SNT21474.1 hypothetical protein SAMN06296052_13151 [Pontibacter ummariensis]